MLPCPECHELGQVIESRRCPNGSRRRRLECSCGHRWTAYQGDPPPPSRLPPPRHGSHHPRALRPDEVRRILEASGSIRSISRQVGRSQPAVAAVLRGEMHADVCPELPRRASLSCLQCQHWTGRCGLGFPDPDEEGPSAASWCNSYARHRGNSATLPESSGALLHGRSSAPAWALGRQQAERMATIHTTTPHDDRF
jgi:Predicted transcriptional regulator, consists of a Zn-ribbon and ATP-cone domains